jgi:hypothetical protein
MLADSADIEQEEHQRSTKYEVQDADKQVEHQGAIHHLLDFFHFITKQTELQEFYHKLCRKASFFSWRAHGEDGTGTL